jgi:putative membrane protein
MNSDRGFLVSQGAAKVVYYVGGFLLLFVPGLHLRRGGGAALLHLLYAPSAPADFYAVLAAAALAGAVSVLLVLPLTRTVLWAIARVGYRRISLAAAVLVTALVPAATGWRGLPVMAVGTGIGLLPVLFGSRRLNCLGVILLPLACMMSGAGPAVARALGLL